jgi:hypothetical protein
MSTRGFEFAFCLDGSGKTPFITDLPVDGAGAYAVGDLCLMNSSGQLAKVTTSTGEVSAVIQEARASGSDGDKLKAAIITKEQVWRCSMDAASTSHVAGYTKTADTVDANTVDANGTGSLTIWDVSGLDDDGNVLAYVVFPDTTWGNV